MQENDIASFSRANDLPTLSLKCYRLILINILLFVTRKTTLFNNFIFHRLVFYEFYNLVNNFRKIIVIMILL
jgi:hypothetical protein